MPAQRLNLPVSAHPKFGRWPTGWSAILTIAPRRHHLSSVGETPAALSERSLARVMLRETGLTFGRWRRCI